MDYIDEIGNPIYRKINPKDLTDEENKELASFIDGDAGSTYIVNDTIPIPVKSDGTFDLEKQKELAAKYEQIETIKSELIERINNLTSIIVTE